MSAICDLNRLAQCSAWLRRLGRCMSPSILTVICVAAPLAARANVITYDLDVTAQVSSYSNAQHGEFITVIGQFQYDDTVSRITSVALRVTGNLQASNLPAEGVPLSVAVTANESAKDIYAFSSDSQYQLAFEFENSLGLNAVDAIVNTPATDHGDAYFYAASDAYAMYHIGYFGVSGSATPVPEPVSFMLLSGSLLGLSFFRRRAVRTSLRE